MKEIQLTRGKVAIVDDEDYDFLRQWRWHAAERHGIWYAYNHQGESKTGKVRAMHREIIAAKPGCQVDHIDHDGLNNRRSNLRLCTNRQNIQNERLPVTNTSGYKGIEFEGQRWRARIRNDGRLVSLGLYETKELAALAYNEGAKRYFGEFACLNVVRSTE